MIDILKYPTESLQCYRAIMGFGPEACSGAINQLLDMINVQCRSNYITLASSCSQIKERVIFKTMLQVRGAFL